MYILTLNCRTYTARYQLFNPATRTVAARGRIERIELGDSFLTVETRDGKRTVVEADCPDVATALGTLLEVLFAVKPRLVGGMGDICAVAHRVTHGGERFTAATFISPEVLAAVRDCADLAPRHTLPNIAGIEAALRLFPAVPHVAVFDTAFHQTMPEHAYLYPLPYAWYSEYGVRRYGFHGASHRHALLKGAEILGKEPAACNLVTVHVGVGVSLCAIRGGCSVDTSMGFTPLEGAVMETRCGDIDPGLVPFIMQEKHLSPREVEGVLNQKSGVLGITGSCATRKAMLSGAVDGDERCLLALEISAYRLRKYIGAYCAVIGRLDAVIFVSATDGSDWPVREKALAEMEAFGIILDPLRNRCGSDTSHRVSADASPVKVFVIPTDEEQILSEEALVLLEQ
ncbi:MAG TPA: acetate kinase [Geobacteraceae bacterium]